jgi:outer membrane immunogenic protein
MKQLTCLTVAGCASIALALTAFAGTETMSSGKEMKQVAPAPPPECNWTGFYIGLNVGGQFGHAEDKDLDDYNFPDKPWGYDQSGVVGGGQVGYNYQWNWLVLGLEGDAGYMNIDGSGREPGAPGLDTQGKSDSDFYTTLRGRLGLAWGHWLFYGTGGAIGVNWHTEVQDDCFTAPCGGGVTDAHKHEFDWGWTAGGGIEYMLNCHWTVRAEYLRYELDDQNFRAPNNIISPPIGTTGSFGWRANDEGNIFRAALNYKF